MNKTFKLFKNFYRDSVTLMQLSAKISASEGVDMASAQMATPANVQMMIDAGLLDGTIEGAAPNDLVLVVKGDEAKIDDAIVEFERMINQGGTDKKKSDQQEPPKSLSEALLNNADATLALISVPGDMPVRKR
jgi:FdrA protein